MIISGECNTLIEEKGNYIFPRRVLELLKQNIEYHKYSQDEESSNTSSIFDSLVNETDKPSLQDSDIHEDIKRFITMTLQ